ncbi:MAG: hypothetical protein J6586_10455, partial [Snodgrassella sp.]|nr:hypothetical protein [Snodgrassella sp.]
VLGVVEEGNGNEGGVIGGDGRVEVTGTDGGVGAVSSSSNGSVSAETSPEGVRDGIAGDTGTVEDDEVSSMSESEGMIMGLVDEDMSL